MTFGEKLYNLRTKSNKTQNDISKDAHISLRAYTSYEKKNIRPRNPETYENLAKALGCDTEYLLRDDDTLFKGMAAGLGVFAAALPLAVLGGPLGAVTGIAVGASSTLARKSHKNGGKDSGAAEPALNEYQVKQEKFRALATGIITSKLIQKGVFCKAGNIESIEENERPDEILRLVEQPIDSWWFKFWTCNFEDNRFLEIMGSVMPQAALSNFITADPDPKRKISFVTDDKKAFKDLCLYKGRNCYRGNFSVILVDIDKMKIESEVYIAHYDDGNDEEYLKLTDD